MPGCNGTDGCDGYPGSYGAMGPRGPNGVAGKIGEPGEPGEGGINSPGIKGERGEDGQHGNPVIILLSYPVRQRAKSFSIFLLKAFFLPKNSKCSIKQKLKNVNHFDGTKIPLELQIGFFFDTAVSLGLNDINKNNKNEWIL